MPGKKGKKKKEKRRPSIYTKGKKASSQTFFEPSKKKRGHQKPNRVPLKRKKSKIKRTGYAAAPNPRSRLLAKYNWDNVFKSVFKVFEVREVGIKWSERKEPAPPLLPPFFFSKTPSNFQFPHPLLLSSKKKRRSLPSRKESNFSLLPPQKTSTAIKTPFPSSQIKSLPNKSKLSKEKQKSPPFEPRKRIQDTYSEIKGWGLTQQFFTHTRKYSPTMVRDDLTCVRALKKSIFPVFEKSVKPRRKNLFRMSLFPPLALQEDFFFFPLVALHYPEAILFKRKKKRKCDRFQSWHPEKERINLPQGMFCQPKEKR